LPVNFSLNSLINFQALLYSSSEPVHFFHGLSVSLLLLLHNLQGPVLFTEYSVASFLINALCLHKVIGSPRTLDMKRDHTLAVLALNAGALVFHSTNDTLQLEAFAVNLVQTHWCLRCHHWPRDPHSTAQVNPFI
jgi:hypothetical protein